MPSLARRTMPDLINAAASPLRRRRAAWHRSRPAPSEVDFIQLQLECRILEPRLGRRRWIRHLAAFKAFDAPRRMRASLALAAAAAGLPAPEPMPRPMRKRFLCEPDAGDLVELHRLFSFIYSPSTTRTNA